MQRCRVQFRCSGRLPGVQRGFRVQGEGDQEAGGEVCRQKCRGGSLWPAEEPGRSGSRTEAVNKAAQAPSGPRDGDQGQGLGLSQDRDGPKTAPNRKKGLGMQGRAPHLYTVGEERDRQTDREGDRKTQRNREDRQERAGSGVSKAVLVNPPLLPSCPDPHSPPKLMTQEAMMMRTPPTSATMLKSLATRPRR